MARVRSFVVVLLSLLLMLTVLSPVALVAQEPEPDLELEISVSTRCVAGNVFAVITARNDNEVPVAAELESVFGTRTFTGVAPGRFASHAFNTRAVAVAAGSVTVRASALIGGVEVAGEHTAGFGAVSCDPTVDPPGPDPDPIPDLDVELTLTQVATMTSPISGSVGPDGRLYLASRAGTVHPLNEDGVGPAVVDISALTTSTGERGLLSIEFAADGSELYLSYTNLAGNTVVEAFAVEDGVVDPDERRIVYTHVRPRANHNGGDIHIGPDGMLYFGHGDSGGGGDPDNVAQDLSSALGSMLRIDPLGGVPYAVPADNPFVGQSGVVEEIWAYGLRNPWRFSFDRQTGDLWIGDVGQNLREEVNFVPAGQGAGLNFGWARMEGTLLFGGGPEPDNHYPPIYEYVTRGPEGCAIVGGYVYRGEAIEGLAGAYLYSDNCVGSIRGLAVVDGELHEQADLGIGASGVGSFAQDADGELYVLSLGGAVLRIDPA